MSLLKELQENICRHAAGYATTTRVPGLSLYCAETEQPFVGPVIYQPMVCVMAQGEKTILLGDSTYRYTSEQYVVNSIDLPMTGRVWNAAPEKPYLALSFDIDTTMLSELLLDTEAVANDGEPRRGLAVGMADPSLLDCFVRLTRLLDEPASIAHLAPLVTRELLYRLLQGDQAQMLRQIAMRESRTAQVARAVRWIREHYAEPFSIRVLADVTNMSAASLHRHFRAVTAMSPLQYQKQVRLQEARRLLVSQGQDAATAAFHVGYASPSQFSREYARTFGKPPRQDAAHLITQQGAAALR